MKKSCAMALLLAAAFSAGAETVAVFLTGGQSNTDGRLEASTLPEYLKSANAKALVSAHSPLTESRRGVFYAYHPASGEEGQPSKWAYDAVLYYHLAQALGEKFYVAKTSYGGTSINPGVGNSPSTHSNAWLPDYGGGFHWSSDAAFLGATVSAGRTFEKDGVTYDGQSMLEAWIENIDAALDAIVKNGDTPDVKAIIWHQGESDKNSGSYAADLTAMVTYVRSHLTEKLDKDCSALPFFCGNIPRRSSRFTVNLDRAFTSIEETEGNYMHVVDIYDLTMQSDNIHFDAQSAEIFGQRLFNRMIAEGVIDGTKLDVADCVRAPDFGTEYVINNTTTWTWQGASGDIARTLANCDGIYFHAGNSDSRKVQVDGQMGSQSLDWTIGDTTSTTVSQGAYCTGYGDNGSNLSTTSTAGENNKASYMAAVNIGRAGKFELFFWPKESGTAKLYLDGAEVASQAAQAGETLRITASNTKKGVYYFGFSGSKGAIMGARFVPDEEMPEVKLEIGESGWGTFGNLYEANFTLPDGVEAFAVDAVDGYATLLSLSNVGALNIGDAVVVKGTPGAMYTLVAGEGEAYTGDNLMVVQNETGTVEKTSGSDFINFIQGVDESGNCIFTKSDGSASLAAGKAFFSITEGDAHAHETTLTCRNTGDTSKFTWTGNGDDTLWTTLENWAWADGQPPLNAPAAGATVTFDEDAIVTFSEDTSEGGIDFVMNADVTFASNNGSKQRKVYPSSVSGTGKLVLGNKINIQTITYKKLVIASDLEVQEGASATITARGANANITVDGEVSGNGALKASVTNAGGSIVFNGDLTDFAGSLEATSTSGVVTINGSVSQGTFTISAEDGESAKAKLPVKRPAEATDQVVTQEAYEAYFTKTVTEKSSGVYTVTVALDKEAVAVDYTLASIDGAALADATSASLQLSNAKPGLYYSIVGGTSVEDISQEGERTLATDATVAAAKPDLGDTNVAYYRIRVSSSK